MNQVGEEQPDLKAWGRQLVHFRAMAEDNAKKHKKMMQKLKEELYDRQLEDPDDEFGRRLEEWFGRDEWR